MKTKDARDIILLALYAEFNREDGDYRRVTANILELEVVPALAIIRLQLFMKYTNYPNRESAFAYWRGISSSI